jgi:hypothetical protein
MARDEATGAPRLTGGCQCGAVRYAVHEAPVEVGICHCRMCQKALGAPFGVFAVVRLSGFTWTRGQPAVWASSSVAVRDFCAACGTPLAFRRLDGRHIELLTGSLDRPDQAVPDHQVGTQARLAWLDQLPHMPGKTTEQSMGAAAAAGVISNQHPDHDTPDA